LPESTLTIIFRGLMVFRQEGSGAGSRFEIGIVPVPGPDHPPHHIHHIPRISTYKNGVLDQVKLVEDFQAPHRIWQLEVEGPTTTGVSTDQQGATFNRLTHGYERDYRWLLDFEAPPQAGYGPLAGKLNTGVLTPVIHIPNGVFYTRLKSPSLLRTIDGDPETEFGPVAAAIACDIRLSGDFATLKVADNGVEVFKFRADATGNTLYDFANTSPDTHVFNAAEEHFLHYYDMFTANVPKFHFREPNPQPAPRPALCGATGLSEFPNSL
jgi:hypothetical protein